MGHVWLNGRLLASGSASLPWDDRGLHYGEGAFETLPLLGGRPFRLAAHLKRLRTTLRRLSILPGFGDSALAAAVVELAGANGLEDGVVRLVVTGGARGDAAPWDAPASPNVLVSVGPAPTPPPEGGVGVVVSAFPQDPGLETNRWKSLAYLERLLARRQARQQGAWEALRLTPAGEVAEGAMSNVFWVADGALVTAPLSLGILPGVTRQAVLGSVRQLGLTVCQARRPLASLLDAQEAFLTSSISGIVPIATVVGRPLPASPGPVTDQLTASERGCRNSFRRAR